MPMIILAHCRPRRGPAHALRKNRPSRTKPPAGREAWDAFVRKGTQRGSRQRSVGLSIQSDVFRADAFIPAAVDTHLAAVIAGLDPAIHLLEGSPSFRWMPGSSPGMTSRGQRPLVLDRSDHIACYHPCGIRHPTSSDGASMDGSGRSMKRVALLLAAAALFTAGSAAAQSVSEFYAGRQMTFIVMRSMLLIKNWNPQSVRFDLAGLNWIGSINSEVAVVAAWHTAPHKSANDLFEQELIVGGTTGVDPETTPRLLNALLDTKFKIVNGYPGTTEIILAMERGELQGIGDWSWSSMKTARPDWLRDKKITLLL